MAAYQMNMQIPKCKMIARGRRELTLIIPSYADLQKNGARGIDFTVTSEDGSIDVNVTVVPSNRTRTVLLDA